jgi:hypothetical protein
MSLWIPASDELFETMPAALQAAKQFGPARWKWHKTPGDGKRTAYLACNAHVDCPVVLKAILRIVRRILCDLQFLSQKYEKNKKLYFGCIVDVF